VFNRYKKLWGPRAGLGCEQSPQVVSGPIKNPETELGAEGNDLKDVGIARGRSVYGLMLWPEVIPAEKARLAWIALDKDLTPLTLVEPRKERRYVEGESAPTDPTLRLAVVGGGYDEIGITEPGIELLIRHWVIDPAWNRLGLEPWHLIRQIHGHSFGLVPAYVLHWKGVTRTILDREYIVINQAKMTDWVLCQLLGDLWPDCANAGYNDELGR
jgi:hypothetical protein